MSLTSDDLADIKQLMQAMLDAQSAQLERRFDAIDKRFDRTGTRLDEQDEKLDEIMNAVGTDLNKHSATLDDHAHESLPSRKRPRSATIYREPHEPRSCFLFA